MRAIYYCQLIVRGKMVIIWLFIIQFNSISFSIDDRFLDVESIYINLYLKLEQTCTDTSLSISKRMSCLSRESIWLINHIINCWFYGIVFQTVSLPHCIIYARILLNFEDWYFHHSHSFCLVGLQYLILFAPSGSEVLLILSFHLIHIINYDRSSNWNYYISISFLL